MESTITDLQRNLWRRDLPLLNRAWQDKVNYTHSIDDTMISYLVNQLPGCSLLHRQGAFPHYNHATDMIIIPDAASFPVYNDYQLIAFHEIIHATGNALRLNRPLTRVKHSIPYVKEELVAELGAAMLCQHFGLYDKVRNRLLQSLQQLMIRLHGQTMLPATCIEYACKAVRSLSLGVT